MSGASASRSLTPSVPPSAREPALPRFHGILCLLLPDVHAAMVCPMSQNEGNYPELVARGFGEGQRL